MRLRTLRGAELACFGTAMALLGAMQVDAFRSISPDSPDPRFARLAMEQTSVVSAFPIFLLSRSR